MIILSHGCTNTANFAKIGPVYVGIIGLKGIVKNKYETAEEHIARRACRVGGGKLCRYN